MEKIHMCISWETCKSNLPKDHYSTETHMVHYVEYDFVVIACFRLWHGAERATNQILDKIWQIWVGVGILI